MRSRALVLTVTLMAAAVLSACSAMPGITVPTAPPPLVEATATAAPAEQPTALAPEPGTSPLPTPAIEPTAEVSPTVSGTISSTETISPTDQTQPEIYVRPEFTQTVPVSPTLPAGQPAEAAATNTYRDDIGGYELDVPTTWWVVDVPAEIKQNSTNYSVTFMSFEPQEGGGQALPADASKIDLTVTKGGAATPEAAAESRRTEILGEGGSAQITFEEPWDLPGGLPATHFTIQNNAGDTIDEVVTAINGNRIVASGLGDAALFKQIAGTLRGLTATAEDSAVTMAGATPPADQAGAGQTQDQVVIPLVTQGENAAATPSAETAQATAAAPAAEAAPAAKAGGTTVYVVKQGDTLNKIAARFGTTVSAILKVNPQIRNADNIYIGQRINIPSKAVPQPTPAAGQQVNIYLIGIGTGKGTSSIGCGDEVVAVKRDIPATTAPLTAALNLLLGEKNQYYGESGLYNALYQSNLSVGSITRNGSDWTVRLNGTLQLGGVCDNPRVKAQLQQTALQFPTVESVTFYINDKTLDEALSLK